MVSSLFWLTDEQMARLQPFLSKSHGKPRVDGRRVLSGIIFIKRNGLRWCDAPTEYGSRKTLFKRWMCWNGMRVFGRIFEELASELDMRKTTMIDATYLMAHSKASGLRAKTGGLGA